MLSSRAVSDFKGIYLKVYKVELKDDEAQEKALSLLNFFKLIYKPVPKKDLMLFSRSPMYEL